MQCVDCRYLICKAAVMTVHVSVHISIYSTPNHFNLYAACDITDCNRVYNLCNTTQSLSNANATSEFPPQRLPSRGQISQSNMPPINCTIIYFSNSGLMVTCKKEECTITFRTNTTACNKDLGTIDHCNQGKLKESQH